MRLLITTDTIGGVWTFSLELVRGLLGRGCAVALVSLGRKPSPTQQAACDTLTERFGQSFFYTPSDTPLEWLDTNGLAFIEAAPLLAQIARQFQPDLLHSNQFCFGALELPIPKVVTAHSDVLSWAQCCGTILAPSPWLHQYVSLVRSGLSGATSVVAPTRWMMQSLAKLYTLPQTQVVISNGRSILGSNERMRTLQAVSAGRVWDPAKGLSLLADVQSAIPIFVAGEVERGSSVISSPSPFVTLLGAMTQQRLLRLFRESAIYLCTSIYEPFGLAPLEAALCGCAVLARDIPSLREVWQDEALYFSDAPSLSQLLYRLQHSPEALDELQVRSSQRAQHFTRDRMVERYLALFEMTAAKSLEDSRVA
jgi:glycogen synthase